MFFVDLYKQSVCYLIMAYEELPHPDRNFRFIDLVTRRGKNIALPPFKEIARHIGNTSIGNFFGHGILIESQAESERLRQIRTSGPEHDLGGATTQELLAELDELMQESSEDTIHTTDERTRGE